MAAIIETVYHTGSTLYAHVRNDAGAVWNGSSFESYNASNWGNYDLGLTEDTSSGYYKIAFPSGISAGKFTWIIYEQTGGSPATSDSPVGTGSIRWNGSSADTGLHADIADSIWDEARSGHTTNGTFGQAMQVVRSGTAQAGAAGTITLDASASAVDDFYNNAILFLVSGTGVGQTRRISDYVGATKVASVNENWVTNPDNTSVFIIFPEGSIPGATAPTAAQVADAVWDEARADHTTSSTFGGGVKVESLNTQAKADVNAEADTALVDVDLDHLAKVTYGNPTVGSLFDKIMNKSAGQTFDATTDSLEAIKDTGSGPTAGQIASAVWDEGLSASQHTTANSAGERLRAIDDKLPSGTLSDFDESTNSVNLNASQSGVTIGTVNALGSTAQGQINAEVVDVLRVDTISELSSGAPTATPTVSQAIMLLYMALRNRSTETGSEFAIYNNAGTKIAKATVADDTVTFSREQLGAP